jgi:hypothetical protein
MAYLWECRQQRLIPSFVPEVEHQKEGLGPFLKQILKQIANDSKRSRYSPGADKLAILQ